MISIKKQWMLFLFCTIFSNSSAMLEKIDGEDDFPLEKKEALEEFRHGLDYYYKAPALAGFAITAQDLFRSYYYTSGISWNCALRKYAWLGGLSLTVMGALELGWLLYWVNKHKRKFTYTEVQKVVLGLKKHGLQDLSLGTFLLYKFWATCS